MPVRWSEKQGKAIVDRRGRPRSTGREFNYLRDVDGYESVPEEIVLDEGAPVILLTVAQLTNFLNIPHINPRPLGRRKKYSRVILSPWYSNTGMGVTPNIG